MFKQKLSSTFRSRLKSKASKKILTFFFVNMLLLLATPLRGSALEYNTAEISTSELTTIDPKDTLYSIDAIPLPESRRIRVAIYDENNLTTPTYIGYSGTNTNNISNLVDILSANENIDITIVDVHDIHNRVLNTANFDVLALVDNTPRENITGMVSDFWLAGGGIIAFDGACTFLSYAGILPPEAVGTNGSPAYWGFISNGYKIIERHPVSKAYALDTSITPVINGYCAWDWSALSALTSSSNFIPIAESVDDANEITILAVDPRSQGGKALSIGFDLDHEIVPELDQLIRDSVDWLAPRPKAKIAFDMSHKPRASIDAWDTYSEFPDNYVTMRDNLVSRGYTVDKLYGVPSGDNFTYDRLSQYDMLICISPDLNYTAGDRAAVEAWVADGGSLLAVSDNPTATFVVGADQLNSLVNPFGMSVDEGYTMTSSFTDFTKHPTTEGVASLYHANFGYINITGSAFPIWNDDPLTNIAVAGNEFGNGRVILSTDINWMQDFNIGNDDNEQFVINIANWLTAATANVLVFVDWAATGNYYTSPLGLALNDLGINFYLTSDFDSPVHDYFNMSLYKYNWDCVIVDAPNQHGLEVYYDDIENYVDSGGMLIMSNFKVDANDTHPLWAKLGFEYVNTFTDQPPVYIWDVDHPIFNQPFDYNAANFTFGTPYSDDGDMLSVLPNGIPLAGLNATETAGGAIIVLREDEQTLYNGYLIDEFTDDIDDSCYADNFELWKNEIAFMMRPKLQYTLNMSSTVYLGETFNVSVEMENTGLSAASLGFIDITIPATLGNTSDDLSDIFHIPRGATHSVVWSIETTTLGNYTINFESAYQGYLGTSYGVTFSEFVQVIEAPFNILDLPWWYYAAAGGGLLLIILIIIISVAVSKKKKKNR